MTSQIPQQLDLFASEPTRQNACAPCPAYVSVVVDIPARALSEPFAYGVPEPLAAQVAVGSTVLVGFRGRVAVGYVVERAAALGELSGADGLDPRRVRPIREVLARPAFSAESAQIARWMSREYVASLAECLRLFLPPGGTPTVRRAADGTYHVEAPAVHEVTERWVSLTPAGANYEPPERAVRQRQLMEALACGPVTTRELNLLYTDLSAAIRSLAARGVVAVEERRRRRGVEDATSLSSAHAAAPEHLTAGQQNALAAIDAAAHAGEGRVILVDGVTGSGKTEVYLAAIERVIAAGRCACVLVPEISLTAQTVGRFRSRFGDAVAVFHSRLSVGERLDQWDMVRSGDARVVVGARSALFCPLENPGLIIIDEEHEQSYKQGSAPRYHAREVAAEMARRYRCPLVLGSATPSAESLMRCARGTYAGLSWQRVEMPERPGIARLPQIVVADLKREFAQGKRSIFSRELSDALLQVAERGEKAVLLHNRRGFAPFLMCRECGCVPTCRHCSTALTYHERTHTLECHTCGAVYHVRPYPEPGSACPQCGSRYLAKMGLGTQQVEDALIQLLPEHVEVIRMDADSTRGKDAHKKLLERFDAAECAVLLGTQMIAKGLDFPEVTLAGVVMADYALKMPDFRASERAYDLLEQLAGRAGRGERPGTVIIQTYLPRDPVIRAVAAHDRSIFTESDLAQRSEARYPPFVRLSRVVVFGRDEARARCFIGRVADEVRHLVTEGVGGAGAAAGSAVRGSTGSSGTGSARPSGTGSVGPSGSSHPASTRPLPSIAGEATARPVVLGPASCVISRAKDRYRFNFMVKSPVGYHISGLIGEALARVSCPQDLTVSVDIDAYDLM